MSDSIPHLSAVAIRRRIRDGELSPTDVADAFLARIRERNERTNAFVTVADNLARETARDAERAIEEGEPLGPLHGVPVAIKDLYDVAGVRTTSGSLLFEDRIAENDALMVERLKAAGAVIVGKTNTPEFGWGTTTANRVLGRTGTPFDPERVAGGSSGGAGAALADSLVPLAQGSDAGGSIRTPASCCGVYGFKPSYGVVPNGGRPNAFTSHTPFINQGPMARYVEDAALMLDVVSGSHPRDPLSVPVTTKFREAIDRPIADLAIGYSPGFETYPVSKGVQSVLDDAISKFETTGATVEEVQPSLGYSPEEIRDAYYTFTSVLFHSLLDNLEQEGFDPRGEDRSRLGDELVDFVMESQPPTTREYSQANLVRTDIFDAIQDIFSRYDLLVTATLAITPFPHGQKPTEVDGVEIDPLRGWVLTQPYNFTGHPAASIPAGDIDGLPVGMQIAGRRFGDSDVLAASSALERRRPWHDTYPD